MASHQQYHNDNVDQLKVCGCCKGVVNSLMEENKKLKAELFEIKKCSSTNKVLEEKLEKMECSLIKKVQEILLNRPPSSLPSNASLMPHQAETSASTSYQLCFTYEGKFPDTFYTKNNIEYLVASLKVELCDHTGKRVEVGPDSCFKDVKVKFLVLDGDLKDDFTVEDFNKYIAEPRKDREALLKDNCEVSLSNGSARVCGFSFTDNSKPMRNGKFRLGAQLTNGDRFRWSVRPAVSPPFRVKENRTQDVKKRPIPSPTDDIHRLTHIGKKGPYHLRAQKHKVDTVLDFLQIYHTNESYLKQEILEINYAAKWWQETVDNAKKCELSNERYKYRYHDDTSGDELLLKCDFNIESVTFKGQASQPYDSLNNSQKEKVIELRKAAYEKRKEIIIKDSDSTNQIPVEAGPEYPSSVEQQEPEEQEQQQPEPAPSNMDPSVQYLPDPMHSNPFTNTYYLGSTATDHVCPLSVSCQQEFISASSGNFTGDFGICTNPSPNSYLGTTAANQVSFQQDVMTAASGSLITGDNAVQNTAMGVGDNSSVAYAFQTEQVAYNGADLPFTAANQAQYKQQMPNDLSACWMWSELFELFSDNNYENYAGEMDMHNPSADMMPTQSSSDIGVENAENIDPIGKKTTIELKWCKVTVVQLGIYRWKKRGRALCCRPQKRQKN